MSIKTRVDKLERADEANAGGLALVLWDEDMPEEERQRRLEEVERRCRPGGPVLVLDDGPAARSGDAWQVCQVRNPCVS